MQDLETQSKAAGFRSFDHCFKTVSFYKRLLRQGSTQEQKLRSELRDPQTRERLRTLPSGERAERGRILSGILSKLCLVAVIVLVALQKWWIAVGVLAIWLFILRPFHAMTQIEALARIWALKEPINEEDIEGFSEMFDSMARLKDTLSKR